MRDDSQKAERAVLDRLEVQLQAAADPVAGAITQRQVMPSASPVRTPKRPASARPADRSYQCAFTRLQARQSGGSCAANSSAAAVSSSESVDGWCRKVEHNSATAAGRGFQGHRPRAHSTASAHSPPAERAPSFASAAPAPTEAPPSVVLTPATIQQLITAAMPPPEAMAADGGWRAGWGQGWQDGWLAAQQPSSPRRPSTARVRPSADTIRPAAPRPLPSPRSRARPSTAGAARAASSPGAAPLVPDFLGVGVGRDASGKRVGAAAETTLVEADGVEAAAAEEEEEPASPAAAPGEALEPVEEARRALADAVGAAQGGPAPQPPSPRRAGGAPAASGRYESRAAAGEPRREVGSEPSGGASVDPAADTASCGAGVAGAAPAGPAEREGLTRRRGAPALAEAPVAVVNSVSARLHRPNTDAWAFGAAVARRPASAPFKPAVVASGAHPKGPPEGRRVPAHRPKSALSRPTAESAPSGFIVSSLGPAFPEARRPYSAAEIRSPRHGFRGGSGLTCGSARGAGGAALLEATPQLLLTASLHSHTVAPWHPGGSKALPPSPAPGTALSPRCGSAASSRARRTQGRTDVVMLGASAGEDHAADGLTRKAKPKPFFYYDSPHGEIRRLRASAVARESAADVVAAVARFGTGAAWSAQPRRPVRLTYVSAGPAGALARTANPGIEADGTGGFVLTGRVARRGPPV